MAREDSLSDDIWFFCACLHVILSETKDLLRTRYRSPRRIFYRRPFALLRVTRERSAPQRSHGQHSLPDHGSPPWSPLSCYPCTWSILLPICLVWTGTSPLPYQLGNPSRRNSSASPITLATNSSTHDSQSVTSQQTVVPTRRHSYYYSLGASRISQKADSPRTER